MLLSLVETTRINVEAAKNVCAKKMCVIVSNIVHWVMTKEQNVVHYLILIL